jgi:3-hydroxyisobutyrate dehydrogenase-like beta-hydroxyacid dehydrogenase
MIACNKTIGVLHLGELGAAVAKALRGRGARVVTTLQGRGEATAARCRDAGAIALPTIADVACQADVVLSLVPPAAAEATAEAYALAAHYAPSDAVYVDMNSISPDTAAAIAARIETAERGFVDAAINGLAKNLTTGGTLLLSGGRAGDIGRLFDGVMRVQLVGPEPGSASAMKMLLAGLSKGVCALFLELAMTAQRQRMLEPMMRATTQIYPQLMALVERMLPTYAQHAARRETEMLELEATVRSNGIEPLIAAAIRQMHQQLTEVPWDQLDPAADASQVVRALAQLADEVALAGQGPGLKEWNYAK